MKRCLIFLTLLGMTLSAAFAQSRKRMPEPINLREHVEYAPSLSADGRTLIFQSDRYGLFVNAYKKVPKINSEGNQMQIQDRLSTGFFGIFETRLHPSGEWTRPRPIEPINRYDDTGMTPLIGGPSISYDGNTLFFFANFSGKGSGREDIYYSVRGKDEWGPPINMGPEINTAGYEGFPSVSADGKRLYFVRENLNKRAEGEMACYRIMMAERTRDGKWKRPIELPAPVNMDCEKAPRIMADSRTLVYSSVKKGGEGDFDLYLAVFSDDGTWSEPKPLKAINTRHSDQSVAISACGDLIYYVSDGDIYTYVIPEELRPFKMATVQGFVTDSITGGPVPTRVVITDLTTNTALATVETNPADGRYTALLPTNSAYSLRVDDPNFRTRSYRITQADYKDCQVMVRDFRLTPVRTETFARRNDIVIAADTEPAKPAADSTARPPASEMAAAPRPVGEVVVEAKLPESEVEKLTAEQAAERRTAQMTVVDSAQLREAARPRPVSETLTIAVQILEAGTDSPITSAKLSVKQENTPKEPNVVLDRNTYRLQVLPGATLKIGASADGYQSAETQLADIREDKRVALKLPRFKPTVLRIRVLDIKTNQPIAAVLTVTSKATGQSEGHKLAQGYLELTYAQPDQLTLNVSAPGYTVVERTMTIETPPQGKIYEFEAKLEEFGLYVVVARAMDIQTGTPLPNARFRVINQQTGQPVTVKMDNGVAQAEVNGKEPFEVFCEADGYSPKSTTVQGAKQHNLIHFRLTPLPKRKLQVPITVYDSYTGEPISAQMSVRGGSLISTSPYLLSATDGDSVELTLRAEGYDPAGRRLRMDMATQTEGITFRLPRKQYAFTFRTLSATTRKPVLNAKVTIVTADTKQRVVSETTYDKTVVDLLPQMQYVVSVMADQFDNQQFVFRPQEALAQRIFLRDVLLNPATPPAPVAASASPPVIETAAFGKIEKGKAMTLNNLFFDQSSPVLRTESYAELDKLVELLNQNPAMRIEIRGHTDNAGDFDLNVKLSQERCQAVVDYLAGKGIRKSRLKSVGRGPIDPVAPNTTEENRRKNRRVEFVIL